jgi:hypothetical protein
VTATRAAATLRESGAAAPSLTARPSRVARCRKDRAPRLRPRWWIEILAILGCDRLYEYIRNLVPTHKLAAEQRGRAIEHLEGDLHINFGLWLNHLVARHDWLAQVMNYYYASLWLTATVALLIWLYIARPQHYRRMRTVLGVITLLGLIGFYIYPLAPPRLMPEFGYIDTIVKYHTWGSWADPTIATHSNQYAAMPSLHTAWALWCAFAIYTVTTHAWIRIVAWLYPVATVLVIVGTANHYLLDAVGGALVFLIAVATQRSATRLRGRRRERINARPGAQTPATQP